MQKIVVNRCFGGFSLSALAVREYLKRKGKESFFYEHHYPNEIYTKIDDISMLPQQSYFDVATKDLGNKTTENMFEDCYFNDREIPRDDPDLVAVVEQLKDEANGSCAELRVVKIPDGVRWVIDEYDGSESVEEEHRSW